MLLMGYTTTTQPLNHSPWLLHDDRLQVQERVLQDVRLLRLQVWRQLQLRPQLWLQEGSHLLRRQVNAHGVMLGPVRAGGSAICTKQRPMCWLRMITRMGAGSMTHQQMRKQ